MSAVALSCASSLDDLNQKILNLLREAPPSPATPDNLARHLGQTKARLEWRLKKLKEEGFVHISGYSTSANGKRAPIFAHGSGSDAKSVPVDTLDCIRVKQIVVQWTKDLRTAVAHHPLMTAFYPELKP